MKNFLKLTSILLTATIGISSASPVFAETKIYKDINGDFSSYNYSHYSTSSASEDQNHTLIFKIDSNEVVSDNTKIYIDTAPFIQDGTTMLPLRAVSEAMNVFGNDVTVNWNSIEKKVIVTHIDDVIIFTQDSNIYTINEISKTMQSAAPILKDDRIYIPLRVLAEAMQLNINWNENTKEITITN